MYNVETVIQDLRERYLEDSNPWFVAYSGGKDSTTVVQLVYQMLLSLPVEQRTKQVTVLSVGSTVENPHSEMWRTHAMSTIKESAKRDNIPLDTVLLQAPLENTYWVTVIGRGQTPPKWNVHWCTGSLKVDPQDNYTRHHVPKKQKVIVLVGDRIPESSFRGAHMMKSGLRYGVNMIKHPSLRKAMKYSPIVDWEDADVFSYLRKTPCPWGDDHKYYLDEYYGVGSEGWIDGYPLVCDFRHHKGKIGRTGCWTCTCVPRDWAMEKYVAKGQTQFKPLLEYRKLLEWCRDDLTTRLPTDNGKIGKIKPEIRKFLLDKLLALTEENPELDAWCKEHNHLLITAEEIDEIHRIWKEQGFEA